MKKKILGLMFVLFILCAFMPVIASAATSGSCGANGDNLTWTLDDEGTLTISGEGDMKDYYSYPYAPWYDIRSSITKVVIEQSVTSIGSYAFVGCSDLTSIDIPNSLTSIGDYAFDGCSSLTSVTIPDNVTSIGEIAFGYCSNLTSIDIPSSVTSIGDGAFAYCNNLDSMYISDLTAYLNIAFDGLDTNPMKYADKLYINNKRIAGTLQIPENITKIPGYAFDGCDGITSVIIPDSVTSIGANAFSNCSGLTSVTIPDSVTKIGRKAFYGCSSLKDVHITDIAKWCEIDFGNDTSNPMYYADNLYVNDVLIAELVIPNSVTSIGNYAFYNCSGLTSVEIPESVISIGQNAFYECDNLKDVHIKDIAKWCEIDFIENGYSSYPSSNPFCYADNLYVNDVLTTELIIPNSVTSIGDYTFYSCSGLTSVKIPNSVTSIGKMAFCRCSKLTDITIPSSIKNIGERTFNNCDCLTSVNYNASKVFSNIFDRYNNIMLVVLGANVKCIDTDAFTDCTKLKRIIISKSVTEIDKAAFKDCTSLTTVEYGGSKTDWNEMYIGTENENLTNANINYNSPLFATENIILTLPTVTSVEDETTRTFTVEIEQPVIGSYVYAVTYDANDMPLNTSKVPLNLFEPTAVVVDKSDNDNYAKIFVWTDEMQPLTYVKPIELQ